MNNRYHLRWVRPALALALLAVLPARSATAQEVVTGWEGSASRGYAFVSPAAPFSTRGQFSWLVRGTLSYLYYDFADQGGRTEVRSPGESVAVSLRYSSPQITGSIGLGYEVRQTRRRLAAGDQTRENETGVVVAGDVFYQATPLVNLSAIASYGDANHYKWARIGAKRQISNFDNRDSRTMHAGVEVTGQGNSDGRSVQVGGLFEIAFPRDHASLQFRTGYSRQNNPDDSHESRPYFGVGYYRAF
jgi:hypothetical protein